jgi:NAD(P)-dependent dehydrogenase (short-subunit alcohol dehydrogenase family)
MESTRSTSKSPILVSLKTTTPLLRRPYSIENLQEHLGVNALGPLTFSQAVRPSLEAVEGKDPKFVVLSNLVASLGQTSMLPLKATAYGASQAAANFIVRRIHTEEE